MPVGVGESLSSYVADVVKIIEASGLPNRTTSMSTEIEGDWDDVMKTVKEATFALAGKGIRTNISLRADIRPGHTNTINSKVTRLDRILHDVEEHNK